MPPSTDAQTPPHELLGCADASVGVDGQGATKSSKPNKQQITKEKMTMNNDEQNTRIHQTPFVLIILSATLVITNAVGLYG